MNRAKERSGTSAREQERREQRFRDQQTAQAREANRILREYAEKKKAPLHVTYPFRGTVEVSSK